MNDLKKPEKRFRPEIEGVRTVATLLIAIYHIWLGRVSGGIDVFFIISGFLITTSLLSRLERTGTVHYGDYLLGLARRLFPQALFVIALTAGVSLFILPKVEWDNILTHMTASVFYFENWRLAIDAVDYLAQDHSASPFQHYWSLGVQGQFYVLWLVLFTAVYAFVKKIGKLPVRKTFLAVLLFLFIISLVYSIYKTTINQPWAYFDTFTRMWEFSIGGILALLAPYLIFPKRLSTLLGWIGLAIICTTGILLPVSTVFPGYLALVPISGVLLILIASESQTTFGVNRFLSIKPFQFLGGLTYGIYLWHWPLLIFYQTYTGVTAVPIIHGVLILALSIGLSYLSTNFLEVPIMQLNMKTMKKRIVLVLTMMLVTVGSVGVGAYFYIEQAKASGTQQLVEDDLLTYPGALTIYEGIEAPEGIEPIPSLLTIREDLPAFYEDEECFVENEAEVKKCSYGVLDNPNYVVAVVGGSHSGHWFPALEILAEELNFQIDVYNHHGCRFTNADPEGHLLDVCLEWNANLLEILREDPPDLVFTTATLNKRDYVLEGYIGQWKELEGIATIFAIRDNPRMQEHTPTCLGITDNLDDCTITRDEGVSPNIPWEDNDEIPSNVIFADLTDYFCNETTCPPVIGNVIVYRDTHHITATYAKTLAPALKGPLEEALANLRKN